MFVSYTFTATKLAYILSFNNVPKEKSVAHTVDSRCGGPSSKALLIKLLLAVGKEITTN